MNNFCYNVTGIMISAHRFLLHNYYIQKDLFVQFTLVVLKTRV